MYASYVLVRCLEIAPKYVQTFGDLGEHTMGKSGRWIVIIAQFGTCLVVPFVFLVLGGSALLPAIFEDVWPSATPNVWIPIMGLNILPFVLIRTLRDGVWVTLFGAITAVVGVVLAMADSFANADFYSDSSTQVKAINVANVFGSMALAYGAAVIIPQLYCEHSNPANLGKAIVIALGAITLFYMVLGVMGYIQYGCVSPGNLLMSMKSRAYIIPANVTFYISIVISACVIISPALYIFERNLFGWDRIEKTDVEDQTPKRVSMHGSVRYSHDRASLKSGAPITSITGRQSV